MWATRSARYFASAPRSADTFMRTKRTTGLAGLAVHPNPLPALESTYTHTLSTLKHMPESAVYRQSAEAVTQQRLDIVREALKSAPFANPTLSEYAIDQVVNKIDCGCVEELLQQAHAEFELAAKMIDHKPYVPVLSLIHI